VLVVSRILFFFFFLSFLGCHNNKLFLKISGDEHVDDILHYYDEIKAMSGVEIRSEYKNKENLYLNEKSKENTLKYVFLMLLPNSEFYNSHRAAYILDEMIMKSGDNKDPFKNIAALIRDIIAVGNKKDLLYEETNKKLDNIISEKQTKELLCQEMSKKIASITEEYEKKESLNKRLNEEIAVQKQAVERLQKKIEELKAIEKSINERKVSKEPTT
jgi:hypothetical protein